MQETPMINKLLSFLRNHIVEIMSNINPPNSEYINEVINHGDLEQLLQLKLEKVYRNQEALLYSGNDFFEEKLDVLKYMKCIL